LDSVVHKPLEPASARWMDFLPACHMEPMLRSPHRPASPREHSRKRSRGQNIAHGAHRMPKDGLPLQNQNMDLDLEKDRNSD
jgi:hypothetical protein